MNIFVRKDFPGSASNFADNEAFEKLHQIYRDSVLLTAQVLAGLKHFPREENQLKTSLPSEGQIFKSK